VTAPHELVRRVADLLRTDVVPATPAGDPRAQAYRASAVLRRVARELELESAHRAADASDRRRLRDDLTGLLAGSDAPGVAAAVAGLGGGDGGGDGDGGGGGDGGGDGDGGDYKAALDRLVSALHRDRSRLPAPTFERVLARVRAALRAQLDRELEIAR
jgi:hypothetical protein